MTDSKEYTRLEFVEMLYDINDNPVNEDESKTDIPKDVKSTETQTDGETIVLLTLLFFPMLALIFSS